MTILVVQPSIPIKYYGAMLTPLSTLQTAEHASVRSLLNTSIRGISIDALQKTN